MADKVFTTSATASGGREGQVKSDNGVINVGLTMPSGDDIPSDASNPEQLFASGYAACFDGALNLMAKKSKEEIDSETRAEVSLLKDPSDNGFQLGVKLHVTVKGVDQSTAEQLVEKAHEFCPYSKATRGNVDVSLEVAAK
ncbi:organic hydroperoxide resistance protein [Geomicrobium sp. JCM 19037]|uniref:organic hydroperoxide resistance protein n=1 Tax=unclassified Geomicrobium TaxID=2628951 RepID=UPI00045F3386|nr:MULTISPECIES: organic hydroperoxide resistance protein [unclassified Geomicrobium]GAK03222.1 organic hydroperoxide resistance protein [Geomicrobium sp. JCM 19037]GAK14553.1 organic hydroperoxide resistance protein [Geomicrobium sp. JCM 19039]